MSLSVVTWKWGAKYGSEYVNRTRAMVARNLRIPHRFFCITDDLTGLDPRIKCMPLWKDWPGKSAFSPRHRAHKQTQLFHLYDPAIVGIFGPRILQLDLDLVITGDITSLIDRSDPIVIYREPAAPNFPHYPIKQDQHNISMLLIDTGVLGGLWTELNSMSGRELIQRARQLRREGRTGNVQCFVGEYLERTKTPTAFFTTEDGVYGMIHLIWEQKHDVANLPEGARAMIFYGPKMDPSRYEHLDWVKQHWTV